MMRVNNNFDKNYYVNKDGNVAIFFDELEIYLHPEWQRRIINILVDWIREIFNDAKSVQVIMTSNSPFIISDIPKDNIVALELNDGKRSIKEIEVSMGANIHELLSNSFFLDFTIGEFTKIKIQNIVTLLKEDKMITEDKKESVLKIIKGIGDPIIKSKLKEIFFDRFPNYAKSNFIELRNLIEERERLLSSSNDDHNEEVMEFNRKIDALKIKNEV